MIEREKSKMKVYVTYTTYMASQEIEVSDDFKPLVTWDHENPRLFRAWQDLTHELDEELLKYLPRDASIGSVTDVETGELLYEE